MRNSLFLSITLRINGNLLTDVSGQLTGPSFKGFLEDGIDRWSQNVGEELSLLAA